MGEIAEWMIAGFQCSHCGTCFQDEHGHPVLCRNCFFTETEDERAGIPRATIGEQ